MTAKINVKPVKKRRTRRNSEACKSIYPVPKKRGGWGKEKEGEERERDRGGEGKGGDKREEEKWEARGKSRVAGRRDCYGGGRTGAFCPRGWAIKISIRFPRELSQPFLHLASVFSPLIKLDPRANGGSTGLQRTHFVIISFNDALLPPFPPSTSSPPACRRCGIFLSLALRLDGRHRV